MALIPIDITSYGIFRASTLGRGFDVDGFFGYQCWDLGAELWGNTGNYSYPYLLTGPLGYVYEAWTVSRAQNAEPDFDLVTSLSDVKRGDMLILGPNGAYTGITGHNAFADQDYDGSGFIDLLGQNQENSNAETGHVTTINRWYVADSFLGAFRYKKWSGGGPTPPAPSTRPPRRNFPWVLYARNLRRPLR